MWTSLPRRPILGSPRGSLCADCFGGDGRHGRGGGERTDGVDDSKVSRILFVGDMHLGRRPGHLVAALAEHGLSPQQLGPAAAWRNVVEYAQAEAVDCVVLAGDLVEADNARFEAFGHLQRGVQELVAADIEVCAVSGNHDVEILPRLAEAIPGFHLIGA